MRNNGITSSFLNLMNNIDYDKYDVSCFTATPHAKEVLKNLKKVNENVRFLFKPGLPVYKINEVYRDKLIHNRGERGILGKKLYPERAYIREHNRLFGKTNFDYVIDFSGYSLYWAKFLLAANAKRKICYMHNDLLSDSERKVNGRRPHRINLRGLFSVYHRFDKLVSVSKGTMELNRKNLIKYADYNKFDYVMNSINPEKILQINKRYSVFGDKNGEDSLITENFKARARLRDINNYYVWNTLPGNANATQFRLEKRFADAEIFISRKAVFMNEMFYKFSFNNKIVGWINDEAIELMPDNIIYKNEINKIARLVKPKGNHIWSKPYKISGITKVSNSYDYKGIIMKVDREAKTQHSIYYRISLNNILIGWIDKSALSILEYCTIDDTMSIIEKRNINRKRKKILSKNYKDYKAFINSIENRTLREININGKMFGKITNPDNHTIWTKAYPNFDTKRIEKAKVFNGEIVKVITINKTRKGTYFLFEIDNEKIGWLDSRAFEIVKKPIVLKEREISYSAKVRLRDKDYIWNKPFGLEGAKKSLRNTEIVNGKLVKVDKESVTQKGTYAHLIKDGEKIGWLDTKALVVNEMFGIEVGNRFISYPAKENINFVNMGRLSPEKGQDNLIYSFAKFQEKHKNSKLYILGEGSLKEDLQTLINELDLNHSVYLMGQLDNPFMFMRKCDCFVLSSHYEGQPMVLLEAMTLGMQIIATDIIANRTVLENGKYGLLVENSISGLEEGLNFIANRKYINQIEKFDYNKYNSLAMETFIKCLS